ncbi:o-succinylbenzoate--CoA ligase [Umezawaea sp. Da 62-37]|uniref:o-succinylbenzoate--CoA ligase n=1 Tax=Umezawaea sp. Da 62-37 TaxID=3075927 RepID=UPI0028F6D5D3|nr:o-succinylbenzoate--CoA ligase [Umezawaea sp. Da 62-37]WNV91014.1 o-succinylbenzoate--CoA ligase [Umezawaea sp. Da 62-37]
MAGVVEAVPVPAGALELLGPLAAALDGTGPAVLPVPSGQVAAPLPLEGWERDAALVVTTSGSTGVPKSVLLSAAALRASATATHDRLGGPGRWLLALPATHIAGVQVLVRSLVARLAPAVLDLAPGFRAAAFADAAVPLLASPGRHYTALVPTQLARLLAEDVEVLRGFDAVLLGGAATPPTLLAAARDAGVRVVTTYGMSETAGGCVYDGVPLDGVRVRLAAGRIELAGPTLALGYRGRRFADGWFRTGDLGRFGADGVLEVLGRADDVIITGGENVPPALVERVVSALPGVREVCVVGLPDAEWGQVVAAAVVPAGPPPSESDVRKAVRAGVGRAAVPKRVVFVAELPTRGPGKVDRTAVARLFG